MLFNAPKNFKRGKYILGRFRIIDLAFIIALTVFSIFSVILYLNLFASKEIIMNVIVVMLFLLPLLIAFLLFIPMPVYFNVLEYIKSFFFFQKKQKKFKWEGIHLEDKE